MRRILLALVGLAVVGAGLGAVLGLFARWAWIFELATHFRGQYALVLGLALAGALALRARPWALAAAILFAVNLVFLAPYAWPAGGAAAGPPLRLVHFNVLSSNDRRAEVVAWLAGSGADVVFVQEVDPAWAAALSTVRGYRVALLHPRRDNFGLAALIRDDVAPAVVSAEVVPTVRDIPALQVTVRHEGRELAVLGLHTLPPVSAEYAAVRDAQLRVAAGWASDQRAAGRAPVILGDFNATPFGPALAPLAAADLRDSLRARAFALLGAGTWPALPAPLRIAIDHCWHDPELVTSARTVGPALGSDHRPLTVELAWSAGGS